MIPVPDGPITMPQEKVPIDISANNAYFLASPPRGLERPPVCRSDKACDFNLTVADVKCSAPPHIINCVIELIVVLRHNANYLFTRNRFLVIEYWWTNRELIPSFISIRGKLMKPDEESQLEMVVRRVARSMRKVQVVPGHKEV